jgi:hypothetical protein
MNTAASKINRQWEKMADMIATAGSYFFLVRNCLRIRLTVSMLMFR